ncbi:MAG: glycerol-3-phosphate 1-O-acyltransferase PlsY [Betaproteobacteria bacterium]|jgi:glycerol-3-phosphate acyltransferase PlsY
MTDLYAIALIIGAYLLGSVSFAVLVSKLMGLPNPHSYGSKNPGATNVLRTGNKKAAILTLLGDSLKGFVAVMLAKWILQEQAEPAWFIGGVALAVFLGHVFPIWHGFQGGKGVATAAGVLFGIHWALGLAALSTWLIMAFFFRYSSLAALTTAIFAPLFAYLMFFLQQTISQISCIAVLMIGIVLIWRHQSNIQKLMNGSEGKIGQKK